MLLRKTNDKNLHGMENHKKVVLGFFGQQEFSKLAHKKYLVRDPSLIVQ